METWVRADGRFMCLLERPDLFGPAVQVIYGGWRSSRVRIVPIRDSQEGAEVIRKLAHRRELHGYRRQPGVS